MLDSTLLADRMCASGIVNKNSVTKKLSKRKKKGF